MRKRIATVVEAPTSPWADGHSDAAILCSLPGVGPLVQQGGDERDRSLATAEVALYIGPHGKAPPRPRLLDASATRKERPELSAVLVDEPLGGSRKSGRSRKNPMTRGASIRPLKQRRNGTGEVPPQAALGAGDIRLHSENGQEPADPDDPRRVNRTFQTRRNSTGGQAASPTRQSKARHGEP